MSRNKYPEKTRILIIETATKLFLEKGYENTTIQDIIDNLGGLTKGAVYHHFKSKEEILDAVIDNLYKDNKLFDKWRAILKDSNLTGRKKIQRMFLETLNDSDEKTFVSMNVDYKKTPHLLADYLDRTVNEIAPLFFKPAIQDGIKDGSIKTDFPDELAEVMVLLINIWVNPIVFKVDGNKIIKKFLFLCDLAEKMGLGGILEEIGSEILNFI